MGIGRDLPRRSLRPFCKETPTLYQSEVDPAHYEWATDGLGRNVDKDLDRVDLVTYRAMDLMFECAMRVSL